MRLIKENMQPGVDHIGVGVGAVIFNEKGELLLLKRGKKARNERGKWEIPGGGVKFGEKLKETVKREVKEELGIEIKVGKLFNVVDEILVKDKQHWVTSAFLCKIKKGRPKNLEPQKIDEIKWFSLNRLPQNLSLATKLDIEAYKKRI